MSYEDAKICFGSARDIVKEIGGLELSNSEQERHDLYEGLLDLTFAIEEDLKFIKERLS